MTFTESVKTCLRKYVDFNGRASRSEYWWFFLFTVIVRVITGWIPFVGFVIALALLLPSLSVTARRLHDTNRTGWWMLLPIGLGLAGIIAGIALVAIGLFPIGVALAILGPVLGFVALLTFLIQPSDPGLNQYGPNPHQPQEGMGAFGYVDSGYPYSSAPSTGSYSESPYDAPPPESEPGGRRFCTQCGMQLEPGGRRFCTACGAEV